MEKNEIVDGDSDLSSQQGEGSESGPRSDNTVKKPTKCARRRAGREARSKELTRPNHSADPVEGGEDAGLWSRHN